MESFKQMPSETLDWSAEIVTRLALIFETSTTGMARMLGMSRYRVFRQIHRKQMLSAEDRHRVQRAIRVYRAALELCGLTTPEQRAWTRQWMNEWLRTPSLSLGGQYPLEMMNDPNGVDSVVVQLARIRHCVYT